MKILLISGHGASDPGAVGNGYKEADLTRELVNLIAPKLRSYARVDVYDQERNAFQDVINGKFKVGQYDYALEIHFNAFATSVAHGTEIYVTSKEKGTSVEMSIIRKMGMYFPVRGGGVKVKDFAVISNLKNKGISSALLEVCFITNTNDMRVYQGSKNAIARDIVAGIVRGFGLKPITKYREHKLTPSDTLWALAVTYLGSGQRWSEISKLNSGLTPTSLPVGKVIKIPNK